MPGRKSMFRWVVWFLAVSFYFYEYLLRISPTVMVPELMTAFTIDSALVGTLSAFYFYSYAPMQLPAGMLMDRFGARRLLTLATLVCALGAILFGLAPSLIIAQLGRFLMGLGSAFAFVGLVYTCSHWFHGSVLALLIGLGNSLGMLGGVAGSGPLAFAVDTLGWRSTSWGLGIAGIFLAITIYLFIKGAPVTQKSNGHNWQKLWENLKLVSKNRYTWVNAAVALLFLATTNAFAGLWATPFLSSHLSKEEAGFTVSTFFVGWILGGPPIGYLSDRLGKRRPLLMICSVIAAALLTVIIYIPLPATLIFILMFILGIFCSCQLLTYSIAIEINPRFAKGTAAALTNTLVFLFSAVVQPFVGWMLDLTRSYQAALAIFPITLVLACLFAFLVKENPVHVEP